VLKDGVTGQMAAAHNSKQRVVYEYSPKSNQPKCT